MKIILSIVCLFLLQGVFAQYTIDPKVKDEFDSLFRRQPKDVQEKRYMKRMNKSFGLLVSYSEDTLNQKGIPVTKEVSGTIKEITLGDTSKREEERYNQWLFGVSTLMNDTLQINVGFGFFSGLGAILNISPKNMEAIYYEYVRRDAIYRTTLTGEKSSDLRVPATIQEIVFDRLPTKVGDTYYAKFVIESAPFYVDDEYTAKGYVHKRCRISCLFVSQVIDPYKQYEE